MSIIELEVPVRRGEKGLGIVVSPQNILLSVRATPQSTSTPQALSALHSKCMPLTHACLSPAPSMLQLAPGGTAEADKKLLVGDRVISVDRIPLTDDDTGDLMALKDKLPLLPQKAVHTFLVQRSRNRLNSMMDHVSSPDNSRTGAVFAPTTLQQARPRPSSPQTAQTPFNP